MKKSMLSLPVKIGVLLTLTLLPFVLLECGLRVAGYRLQFPYTDDPDLGYVLTPGYTGPGSELYGLPRKIVLKINSLGFRGDEIATEKSPHERRVLVLGDSCSFGLGLETDQTYAALTQKMLNETIRAHERVEVINTGVPGYTSYQGLQMLKTRGLALQPDVAVIYFGWNDHWFADRSAPDSVNIPRMHDFIAERIHRNAMNPLQHTRTFQLLTDQILRFQDSARQKAAPPKPDHPVYRVPLAEFSENLRSMVRILNDKKIPAILITPPHGFEPGKIPTEYLMENLMVRDESLIALHESYVDAVRAVAKDTHSDLLDMDAFFAEGSRNALMEKDGIHPNAAGHRVIAQELAKLFRKILFKPSETK